MGQIEREPWSYGQHRGILLGASTESSFYDDLDKANENFKIMDEKITTMPQAEAFLEAVLKKKLATDKRFKKTAATMIFPEDLGIKDLPSEKPQIPHPQKP